MSKLRTNRLLMLTALLGPSMLMIGASESRPGLPTLKTESNETLHEPLLEAGFDVKNKPELLKMPVAVVRVDELMSMDNDLGMAQDQVAALSTEVENLRTKVVEFSTFVSKETFDALQKQLTEKSTAYDELNSKYTELQTSTQKTIDELNAKINAMPAPVDTTMLNQRIADLTAQITQKDETIAMMQRKIDAYEAG